MKSLFVLLLLGITGTIVNCQEGDSLSSRIEFISSVYKELIKTHSGNSLTCLISLEILLALLRVGAQGTTANEISEVLGLPDNPSEIADYYSELSENFKSTDFDLHIANKIVLQNGFEINDHFRDVALQHFDADIENVDFELNEKVADDINSWVKRQTQNKITNLISPQDLLSQPIAVVINALYFSGKWLKRFRVEDTQKKVFHLDNDKEELVDMMEMADKFMTSESENLKAKFLEMPYEGKNVTMTFVLPTDIEGLSELEARIDEVLSTPIDEEKRAHVIIPKFKDETTIHFKPILQALGMVDMFSRTADFGGIVKNVEELYISKIIQKSFIEVHEEGATAAAGTSGFVNKLSGIRPPVMQFVADHPFLYYIKVNGFVIFIGRYTGV